MKVCYTALFGNYEELKEPKVVSAGWEYICFTDQPVNSQTWQVKKVKDVEIFGAQVMARYYKIMEWIDWEQSIWVDASFIIDTDLNKWWDTFFQKGFAAPKHPLRNCVYNEALDCIISKRGNKELIQEQMNEYKKLNIPANNGVIQSGILMRENTPEVIQLCESWWQEVSSHSTRDQIAFCKVALHSNVVHTYHFDYRRERDFIYKKHFHLR